MVRHTGEDFIDVKGVTVAAVVSFQTPGVQIAEFYAPKADRLTCDNNDALSHDIFNVTVAEIESVVEPDGVIDNIGWESIPLVGIHPKIPPILESLFGDTR